MVDPERKGSEPTAAETAKFVAFMAGTLGIIARNAELDLAAWHLERAVEAARKASGHSATDQRADSRLPDLATRPP